MTIVRATVLGLLLLGVTACGTKGKLKTPSQIATIEAEKKAKAAKAAARAKEDGNEELELMQSDAVSSDKPEQEKP